MTGNSVELGRNLDASPVALTGVTAVRTAVTTADSNRIGVALAVNWGVGTAVSDVVAFGPVVNGVIVPVLVLTPSEASGYLSVDRLGSVVTGPLFYIAVLTGAATIGVTCIRPIRSWDEQ